MGGGLSARQMAKLVQLARLAISKKMDGKKIIETAEAKGIFGSDFEAVCMEQGAFVTLTIGGSLRGCIGSLVAEGPLWESVRDTALNAAFGDTRFTPLSKEEIADVKIEVSVLSPLREMKYSNWRDLLSSLQPGAHGLLLRFANGAGATYLPQVWEQIPKKEDFLSSLCMKAGMPPSAWKAEKPEAFTYTVQMAEENSGKHPAK